MCVCARAPSPYSMSTRRVFPDRVHPDVWRHGHALASIPYDVVPVPFDSMDVLCNALLAHEPEVLFDNRTQLHEKWILFLGNYDKAVAALRAVLSDHIDAWKIQPDGYQIVFQVVRLVQCEGTLDNA